MPNEERPQDFELIELLIREAVASTPVQQSSGVDESFKARFQSYIDQIPSYMHSVEKKGFFPHFFFGSFSTLLDTEIAKKLGIERVCFSFDGPQTLKVAVIKKGEIKNKADAIDKVRLFVVSEQGAKIATQRFSYGELRDALGRSDPGRFRAVFDSQDELKVKLVTVNKDKINQQGMSVGVEDKNLYEDNASRGKFKEIEKGLWSKPEDDIAKLAGSDEQIVRGPLEKVLEGISKVHSKYEDSLKYGTEGKGKNRKEFREAAHHAFIAGALNNFRYRYNLRAYLEQFAGRGYADIVLLARGPNRALDSIPAIIELKAATPEELKKLKKGETIERSNTTPTKALEQAKNYAKGFQPNVQRVLTTADEILCVGVNLDYPSPISNIEVKSREGRIIPFFQSMLKSTDEWNRNDIDKEILKTRIQDNIERIYHTFPGTGEKRGNHYFSRFLLGQSLLLNKVLKADYEKHIFIYNENIPTEIRSKGKDRGVPQREKAKKADEKLAESAKLDGSHAVVSMVLIPENDEKLVYLVNVVEADGRAEVLSKGVPLDNLNQKIGNRKIAELNLNFNVKKQKSDFKEYFNIEANEYASLEQYNEKKTSKFEGSFKDVPYPDQLKETFDRVLDSQLTSTRSSSIVEYNELFKKLGKAIFPFESLVNRESDFQGVLNGASSYYSDLKLQESPETKALVLTEFQTGRGERIDMLVHGIKFEGDAKEYTPIGLELKGPRGEIGADALKKEANDQITKEYERGVTYKTLTDGDEVKFIGVVFNKKASDANSLILASRTSEEGFIPVKVVHSSTQVLPTVGQCSKERKKRNIGMSCVDSRDEEDITKEEKERRIKELLSNEMIMKIKLKELESKINDEVLSRHEEIENVATYDVNKSDLLSNALQSLKLSKMLLLMSQKSEVSIELQEKAYYNALIDIGALIHDHKNHVHGDHLSALESRVQGNQLFSVAHDLYYLLKSEGNVDQDKLYSDQVKSKISSYVEGENGLDDIYSEFNIIDIKGYFSDSDVKDFYAEAEAYGKEVITIHSTQVFADEIEVYVEVKDNNGNHQKVVIGNIASIQNTENYILDEETSEIKLRIDDDKEYTTTQELEEEHVKHYLNIPGGYEVKVGNVISSFTEDIKEAIHSKLHRLELLASKKAIEEIGDAKITDQDYNNFVGEIKQSLLQEGVIEGTSNQLIDHIDNLGVDFAEYISDIEKKLEGHGIEFDRNKFDSAKVNGAKGGKFFFLMTIYDLFDNISDVPTLGRHDNDALKKIFGINGILDAMNDVRTSISTSYTRSDGKVTLKIPRDSAIGKVISKIPDHIRKTFVKVINSPVVEGITFVTIAYQFGYSIDAIVKGDHHPLNYYFATSSGIKLTSMSMKMGVSAAVKGLSATTKTLRVTLTVSKGLGKLSVATAVLDLAVTTGINIYETVEYVGTIASEISLSDYEQLALSTERIFNNIPWYKWTIGEPLSNYYESAIKVKSYLGPVKEVAEKILRENSNVAAVVQYATSIEEKYSEIIRSFKSIGAFTSQCITEYNYTGVSFDEINSKVIDLFQLNIFEVPELIPDILYSKKVYLFDQNAKHLPHVTLDEYNNGLRVVVMPLNFDENSLKCGSIINEKVKSHKFPGECNNGAIHRNCTKTFTLSGEPFIFSNITRSSSCSILYLSGPNQLIAADGYPAVMHVPKGKVDYTGSPYHSNTFIINYRTYGRIIGGKAGDTIVMNYNTSDISVELNNRAIEIEGQRIFFYHDIYNYISHSTANQYISTNCKTRYVDAGEGGGNNFIRNHNVDCQDKDYEVRKVNKKDTHLRSTKQTTFIIDKSSGNGASIIHDNDLKSKKNLDKIFMEDTDIVQLRINEHQTNYGLELLAGNEKRTVASVEIDSFEKLATQIRKAGITKTITVQNKSPLDIITDIEYQKLNHSGTDVGGKIMEGSKKRSKAVVLVDITGPENVTAYEVAKNIINNNNLGIPIFLVQVEKVMDNVAHEAVVENVYSSKIVADFSRGNINCKKVITVEMEPNGSKCIVKLPQAYECDHPVDFALRIINNPTLYASASDQIVDLTECNINPENVECKANGEYATGIILNSHVNQGSFQVILDNYLQGQEYQHIAFQFNNGGEFYKINGASLKIEPVLYNYEKKVKADYDSFRYYDPDEQGLRIYHNQPDNENKTGFIDLKDKSILDCNVKIIDDSLVLSYRNNTLAKVENWITYPIAMIFAFNGTTIFNSNCNSESIIAEFMEASVRSINQAIKEDKLDEVKLFLDKNASRSDNEIRNKNEWSNTWTLLHYAVYNGHLDVVKGAFELLLEKSRDINAKDGRGWTPLHYAAYYSELSMVNFLIEKNASTNAIDLYGKTPLHLAAREGNLDVATSLINKGDEINSQDNEGWTPLIHAIFIGHVDMFQLLLDKNANIKVRSNEGWTPLHWAINLGSLYMMRSLIGKGDGIEDEDNTGWRPLHYAVEKGYFDMVKILVEKGADISAETGGNGSKTPLGIATDQGHDDIVEYLKKFKKENKKPVQRKRRHHHGDHDRHHSSRKLPAVDSSNQPEIAARQDVSKNSLQNDEIDHNKGGATSGTSKPSSWINVFANTIVGAVKGASQFISSPFKPAIDMEHSQPSKAATTQGTDVNGTLFLLDVFIRKITGKKYISTADQPTISLPEAVFYASDIVNGFEKVLKETAIKSGISVTNLNFDPMKLQSAIVGQLINGKFSEISKALYSSAKQVCPADFKQNKKFLSRLETRIEGFLDKKEKEFSSIGPKRKEAKQIHKRELCSSPNFITDNLTTLSLANASRSESQLPGKTDDKPRTCLNDPTVDKHLQRSL